MRSLALLSLVLAAALASGPGAGQVRAPDAGTPEVAKTNVTTDVTDLWWNPSESGWGIQLVQNRDVVFATLFVYDLVGAPTFFVAVLENPPGGGTGTWSGPLYATTGPWFGGAFNPAVVTEAAVGSMSFSLTGIGTGALQYSVGGTNVSKTIERQTLRLEDNTDFWAFVHTWKTSGGGCGAADAYNDSALPPTGVMHILNVDPDTAVLTVQWRLAPVDICSATVQYTQTGRLGQYTGALSCPASGRSGTLTMFELANRVKGLNGRYTMAWAHGCTWAGRFAGVSQIP